MNDNERQSGRFADADVIGRDIDGLLRQLPTHISNEPFRDRVKRSLQQLADLKFALDESTIVAVTDRRGTITFVNDRFCEISRFRRDELLGQDHRIINSGYHGRTFMRELWSVIRSGRVWRGEIKNRAKDGSFYWVYTTIVPFLDEDGKPYQYLAIRNEITPLKKAEEELQQTMTRLLHIEEEQRRRFSRELHDGIGQSLYSLLIGMDRLIAEGTAGLEPLRREVTSIIEEVRGLAWELRPSVLDDLGIVPAIRSHVASFSQHFGVKVAFDCRFHGRLDARTETAVYRIIQEALTNVGKYADVEEASVRLLETATGIEVTVADAGGGFDLSRRGQGVGLFSMEERARGVGGRLAIDTARGRGTVVTLVVPRCPPEDGG